MICRWRVGTRTLVGSIQKSQRRSESLPRPGGMDGGSARWLIIWICKTKCKMWPKKMGQKQSLDPKLNLDKLFQIIQPALAALLLTSSEMRRPGECRYLSVKCPSKLFCVCVRKTKVCLGIFGRTGCLFYIQIRSFTQRATPSSQEQILSSTRRNKNMT